MVFWAVLMVAAGWLGVASAFEQDQRMTGFTLQPGKDAFATANALGAAFTSTAQSQLNSAIASQIADGSFTLLLEMPGLADPTGTNAPGFQVGLVSGFPVLDTNNPTPYSGDADLDWWYTADPATVDASGRAEAQLAGSIAAQVFSAQASELTVAANPFGTIGDLRMSSAAMQAAVRSPAAPLESTNNFPPGHLPDEHISPTLVSFAAMTNGQWKGNISAASLAAMPFNLSVSTDQGYTSANSMLDLLVSGATTFNGFIRLVNATQPDQADANMPVAGAGPPYTFTANSSHIVIACHDKNGAAVPLTNGLNAAAYSAYFKFTTDRVIAHNVASGGLTPPALSAAWNGTTMMLTVTAQGTTTCTVEYKDSLPDANWTWLQTFTGTGAASIVLDSNPPASARFYRARVQ